VFDPEAYRADTRRRWEQAAAGWAAHRDAMQSAALPVSRWLIEAIRPQPGHVVLELAAGIGDTGLLAAELVRPGGKVIITDGAEAMVAAARARAEEVGADNVELRTMEAEWIDLPAASVDGVLCRWGYMLLVDPETALRETRRVLKPGGRVALAAWDAIEHNPWIGAGRAGVAATGLVEPPPPGGPDPFAFAEPGRIEELLGAAGFDDVEVERLDFAMTAPDLDAWWAQFTETSPSMREAISPLAPADHYRLREAVDAAYAPYVRPDGSVRLPARALVAAASA
jgi:SAM-dependent methyltransferase